MHRLKHPFRRRVKPAAGARHRPGARRKVRRALLTAAALSLGMTTLAHAEPGPATTTGTAARSLAQGAETPEARLARWKEAFDAFAEADRQHAPAAGGVLFVGSSSIRLWDSLEHDFQALPVVTKRGFGGSRLSDCSDQVARLVLPYKPSVVIVYAGDNDLAEGATPSDVAASFRRFVEAVRKDLPSTRIAYLSIKPSPSRAALMPRVRETNAMIAAYTATVPNLDYIDVFAKMLSSDGAPRPELFKADLLHLNHEGYALWQQEIVAHLGPLGAGAASVASAPLANGARHDVP